MAFKHIGQLAEKIITKIREERGRAWQTGPRAPKGGDHQKAQGCPARDPRPKGLGRRPGPR
jgi:hypothetical protein